MNTLKSCYFKKDLSSGEEKGEAAPCRCAAQLESPCLRLRGIMMRRRCDFCGTRMGVKGEGKDRVVLECPDCQKE